jgi:hypothetical protein
MKMFVIILSLLGSTAFADMKAPGTFVPTQCGSSSEGQICLGQRQSMPGRFLSVSRRRAMPTVFEIVKSTPVNGGMNPSFSAVSLDLVSNQNQNAHAVLYSSHGKITNATVFFSSDNFVSVGAFELAFVTM